MERQLERKHENEPLLLDTNIEDRIWRLSDERRKKAAMPRVLKPVDTPWAMNAQAYARMWIGADPKDMLARVPIHTMSITEQIIPPSAKSGRHRHVREAIFYIMDGKGYEIHDGKRYDWETGDIMTVPSYCDHQHFNTDTVNSAHFFFSVSPIVDIMGVHWVEQIELKDGYRIPEGAEPIYNAERQLIGYKNQQGREFRLGFDSNIQQLIDARRSHLIHVDKPRDEYEEYMKLLEDEVDWRQSVPHVVKSKEVPWANTRMGRLKFLVTPKTHCGLKTYDAFLQEIPPGGRSGKHCHVAEEVHKILEGTGYDIQNGVKYDWEADDMVAIPPNTVHQHFNADRHKPVRFVAFQSRWYHHMGHGGIEHLEDAAN